MKKLLVLALAVVLTLSLTVVASAATFDPYVGGRVTLSYISTDVADIYGGANEDQPITYNNSGLKMLLRGKISDEETGTWATIGAKIDGWADNDSNGQTTKGGNFSDNTTYVDVKSIYDIGIKNVGGSNLSVWFTNWENENMKRGQAQVYNIKPNQYHDDPIFNQVLNYGFGFDYVTDNVKVNIGYDLNKNEYDKNHMIAAATFNFDGGDVHVGIKDDGNTSENNVGGSFKLGFGTIKADYIAEDSEAGDDGNLIQVAVFFDDLKFDVTLISDSEYYFEGDGGMGYQIRYTGIDKVVFGYRAMEAAEEGADENSNFTDLFVGYKYGVIETRLGMGTISEADDNDFVYASVYASLW